MQIFDPSRASATMGTIRQSFFTSGIQTRTDGVLIKRSFIQIWGHIFHKFTPENQLTLKKFTNSLKRLEKSTLQRKKSFIWHWVLNPQTFDLCLHAWVLSSLQGFGSFWSIILPLLLANTLRDLAEVSKTQTYPGGPAHPTMYTYSFAIPVPTTVHIVR